MCNIAIIKGLYTKGYNITDAEEHSNNAQHWQFIFKFNMILLHVYARDGAQSAHTIYAAFIVQWPQ